MPGAGTVTVTELGMISPEFTVADNGAAINIPRTKSAKQSFSLCQEGVATHDQGRAIHPGVISKISLLLTQDCSGAAIKDNPRVTAIHDCNRSCPKYRSRVH